MLLAIIISLPFLLLVAIDTADRIEIKRDNRRWNEGRGR